MRHIIHRSHNDIFRWMCILIIKSMAAFYVACISFTTFWMESEIAKCLSTPPVAGQKVRIFQMFLQETTFTCSLTP